MRQRPSAFRQVDVMRAVKAATKAGMCVGRVEIDPDGKIVLVAAKEAETQPGKTWEVRPWT